MLFTMRDELRRQDAQRFEIVGAEMEERSPAVGQGKVGGVSGFDCQADGSLAGRERFRHFSLQPERP